MNGIVLQARNRAGLLLRFTTIATIASLAAFAVGVSWGALGVAIAYATVMSILTPVFMHLTARELGIPFTRVLQSLAGVAMATLAMVAALLALRLWFAYASERAPIRLVILILTGAIVYLPLLKSQCPEALEDIREVVIRPIRARRLSRDGLH